MYRLFLLSREGRRVALICSGDAQVYGMASLLLGMAEEGDEIEVVPGVTAALSAAAVLGSPLCGDFAVVSLSDQLTPWATIERRLRAAAAGGFPIALYNPCSRHRPDHLARACAILMETLPASTVCGYVQNIGRDGQKSRVLTLGELVHEPLDMFTTVLIGNAETQERFWADAYAAGGIACEGASRGFTTGAARRRQRWRAVSGRGTAHAPSA